MTRRLIVSCLAFALNALPAAAAAPNSFGLRGGLSLGPDQFVIGAQMLAYEFSPRVRLKPNVEVGFGNNLTLIDLGGAVDYAFGDVDMGGFTPYAGGELGLIMWRWSEPFLGVSASSTELSLSGLVAVSRPIDGDIDLFFQLEVGISSHSPDLKFIAGVDF